MKDKKTNFGNGGLATMEIIVAAVILAVVIIGVIVVIKLVSGSGDGDKKESAAQQVTGIGDAISNNLQKADLEIMCTTKNNDVTLRLIGRENFQIFQYNATTQSLYFDTKTYATATTDEEKIKAARNTTLDTGGATMLNADGSQVKVFLVQLPATWDADARLRVSVRVEDADDSEYKDFIFSINEDLIALKNGTYKPPVTPTPDGDDPEPTPTTKPADPTPTPTPEDTRKSETLGWGQKRIDLKKLQDYLEQCGDDTDFVITIKFTKGSAKKGWGVGGICIGKEGEDGYESCQGDTFEHLIDFDPKEGDTDTATWKLADVVKTCQDRGAESVFVNFYNGFSIEDISVMY